VNVAYDHQVFCTQRQGGVSRYFSELVGELQADAAIGVTVMAPLHINEYLLRPQIRRCVAGFHIPNFRGAMRAAAAVNSAILPIAWLRSRFDVIHETYYSLIRRGRCRARVITVYDMIHELFPSEFPDWKSTTHAKRASVDRADHIVCISETTRRDLVRMFEVEPSRTTVIYLGSSLQSGLPLPIEPVTRTVKPYVLYVGNRCGYKNFQLLLSAFARSRLLRSEFELVAFGGGALTVPELQLLGDARLRHCVRQVSGNDAKLAEMYLGAAAFVYPSRYEGFGIPPLEAMEHDCPVVCSNAGSMSEVVGDAGAYFDPLDVDDLRNQLEHVISDQVFAAELRRLGRLRIQQFSWQKCAEETLALYGRLIA